MTKLNTAKELQADEKIEYDSTLSGKIFETKNPQWHTTKHVNTYFIDCLDAYESYGRIDEELWESFQEDFEGWTEELFTFGHKRVRSTLRDFLRDHGVYVGGPKYISQQLFALTKEEKYKEWPVEEIERQLKTGREFNSYQNPMFRAMMEAKHHQVGPKDALPPQATEKWHQQVHQHQEQSAKLDPGLTRPGATTSRTPMTPTPVAARTMNTPGPAPPVDLHENMPRPEHLEQTIPPPSIPSLMTKALTDLESQGVPACKLALLKPAATFESVASDLRNAVGVEMRCRPQAPQQYLAGNGSGYHNAYNDNDVDVDGQFWVDRRYEGRSRRRDRGPPRGGGYKHSASRSRGVEESNRLKDLKKKKKKKKRVSVRMYS